MFERKEYTLNYLLTHLEFKNKLNKFNIEKTSIQKINKLFKNTSPQMRFVYLHNTLAKYNKYFYKEDYIYLDKLRYIIKINKLILNAKEEEFLYLLEERIFNKNRKLKSLDTNITLLKNEKLYVKYKRGYLYFFSQNIYKNIINGEILITNKRIIINTENHFNNYEFYYSEMKKYWYKKYGFEFYYGEEQVLLRSHDQRTLCNIIKRLKKDINS